jgi:hypothetical protein
MELTAEQLEFVAQVKAMCIEHYDAGGDYIVECFGDDEIVFLFRNLLDVVEHCGLFVERALNCRLGSDTDPELTRYASWEAWRDSF